jgi:hypothetical protein
LLLVLHEESLALYWLFSSGVGVILHNLPANWKQRPIPEEMSQTLLTNKKQGNLDSVRDANIIKPT